MLTAQQSSTSVANSAKSRTSKASMSAQPLTWGVIQWLFIWLLGAALLSLALMKVYQLWIEAPQERLTQEMSELHLRGLAQVVNTHDAKWQSSLESLTHSRLLIIAIAQKSLSTISDSGGHDTPLIISPTWIQALQEGLGANTEWHVLLSPDEFSSSTLNNADGQTFSFTDQLIINGCFQGQNMPTEIRQFGDELMAHRCLKVSMPVSQKLAAPSGFNPILFVRFPITKTLIELQKNPPDFGQVQWTQHFGDTEENLIVSHGLPKHQSDFAANTVQLNNPLWRLSFHHGGNFPTPKTNPIFLGGMGLATLLLFSALTTFCLNQARPNHRKAARARFQQTLDFEDNLNLIDFAIEDVDWVTGGSLNEQGSSPPQTQTKSPSHKKASKKERKKFTVHSSSRKFSALRTTQVSESPTLRPVSTDETVTDLSPSWSRSKRAQPSDTEASKNALSADVFRAYDIRGSQGNGVDANLAFCLGVWLGRQSQTVYVGRDCRLTSPELYTSLINGLTNTSSHIETLGLIPTPLLHFATALHPLWQLEKSAPDVDSHSDAAMDIDSYLSISSRSDDISAVMITASHNPAEENGFKLMINGKIPSPNDIKALYQSLLTLDLSSPEDHLLTTAKQPLEPEISLKTLKHRYIDAVSHRNTCPESCRIVIDAGNGAASELAPALFDEMGCEVIPLNCEFDGHFPNRTPDSSDEKQLTSLVTIVHELNADLGIAFDGDGDRLAVVTASGHILRADELLMLFTRDALSRNPGKDVVFDVKCSRNLVGIISQCGGRPVMSQTGHNHIQQKMQSRNAVLGGDFSGHICFTDHWIGSDDGLYAAARLLDILDQTQLSLDELIQALPKSHNTPEIRLSVPEEAKQPIMEQLLRSNAFSGGKITTIDGIRVDYPKSWGLIRASNTSACLTLRFEGSSEAELARVQYYFKQAMQKVEPSLELPF